MRSCACAPTALPAIEKAAQNGGCKEAGELYVQGTRIEHGVKGIAELGILVKDLDMGLVDFLGTRDGHEVFLCWHYGEDDIDLLARHQRRLCRSAPACGWTSRCRLADTWPV